MALHLFHAQILLRNTNSKYMLLPTKCMWNKLEEKFLCLFICVLLRNVPDCSHFDPDPTFHLDANPDPFLLGYVWQNFQLHPWYRRGLLCQSFSDQIYTINTGLSLPVDLNTIFWWLIWIRRKIVGPDPQHCYRLLTVPVLGGEHPGRCDSWDGRDRAHAGSLRIRSRGWVRFQYG